jgi:hypothetical protein
MSDEIEERLEQEARKALRCLYIAVEAQVADDVKAKVTAWTDALRQRVAKLEAERDGLTAAMRVAHGHLHRPGAGQVSDAEATLSEALRAVEREDEGERDNDTPVDPATNDYLLKPRPGGW